MAVLLERTRNDVCKVWNESNSSIALHLTTRVQFITLLAIDSIVRVCMLLMSVLMIPFAALSVGKSRNNIVLFTAGALASSHNLLVAPYKDLILFINPSATFGKDLSPLAEFFAERFKVLEKHAHADETNCITARCMLLAKCVVSIVICLFDALLAVLFVPLSFLTLGMSERINSYAQSGLRATRVIYELCMLPIFLINRSLPALEPPPQAPSTAKQ